MRDREFMLVRQDGDAFKMMTARQHPQMLVLEVTRIDDATISLDGPGMETLEVSLSEAATGNRTIKTEVCSDAKQYCGPICRQKNRQKLCTY